MPERSFARGAKSVTRSSIAGAARHETRSAWRVASVFGVTSPKTRRMRVVATVAVTTPQRSPKSSMARTVPMEPAAMLTSVFPIRSVLIVWARCPRSRSRRAACGCLFSFRRKTAASESVVRAVSEPEKKVEAPMEAAKSRRRSVSFTA